MAKQRGIIQISGKINDHVYYEQKYVDTGLIRKQNAAMSGRVKSDPEFENTRRAGQEFGYSSQSAAAIIKQMPQRSSSVVFPFILPRFTRTLYKYLRAQTGSVGSRSFLGVEELAIVCTQFLNRMSKNQWSGLFPPLQITRRVFQSAGEFPLTFDRLAVQAYLNARNFDAVRFTIYDEGEINFGSSDGAGGYTNSYGYSFVVRQRFTMSMDDSADVTQDVQYTVPSNGLCAIMVLAEPVKYVNGQPTYPKGVRSFIWGCVYYQV